MFEGIEDEFEEAIDAMPPERQQLAFQRACKRLDIEYWYEGKTLCTEADPYDPDLVEAFGIELQNMVMEDALHDLSEGGYLVISTDDDGELTYALTDKGKDEAKRLIEEKDGPDS